MIKKNSISKTWIITGVIVVVILIFSMMIIGSYNGLVQKDVTVTAEWGKVQSAYQRRADLIPNLVETVKGSANFEKSTLEEITKLRSEATQVQSNAQSASTAGQLQQVQTDMSGILSRISVIVEAYPTLKSNANFLALQDELAGTENRIKFERDNYNNAVKDYQISTRTFPRNIIAGIFGFSSDKYSMFQSDAGADKSPKVGFN